MAPAKKGRAAKSMPKKGKDPKVGLTAAGRAFFKDKDGSNLRPGVRGKADTPEKMMRKGSFLRRHYANPPGPVVDAEGQPTRQALQAAAWGEPVPKNEGDERKLAEKGSALLEQYHAAKGDGKAAKGRAPAKKAAVKKASGVKGRGAAKKTAAAASGKSGGTRASGTKGVPKKTAAAKQQAAKAVAKRARG